MTSYSVSKTTTPFSDFGFLASSYGAGYFLKIIFRVPRKSRTGILFSVLERYRTKCLAKLVCLNASRVHANIVYDSTKIGLPPMKHSRQRSVFPGAEKWNQGRYILEFRYREFHWLTVILSSLPPNEKLSRSGPRARDRL